MAVTKLNGGQWNDVKKQQGFNSLSPITVKGSLITHDGTNNLPLTVGTNDFLLVPDSSVSLGLKYIHPFDIIGKYLGQVTSEPTGFTFSDNTESTLSFVNSTRTFSISPVSAEFTFYVQGVKYSKTTTQSLVIPDVEGSYYFYFDDTGTLTSTTTFDLAIIRQFSFVSSVYWDATNKVAVWNVNERHGKEYPGAVHAWAHTYFGSDYKTGFGLTGFTIGNGSLDTHARFTAESGTWSDEDINFSYTATANIPIIYRLNTVANPFWRRKDANTNPFLESGATSLNGAGGTYTVYTGANARPAYNSNSGGNYSLVQVSEGAFFNVHYAVFNDESQKIVGFLGTSEFFSPAFASQAIASEVNAIKANVPLNEFIFIGTVTFEASSAFANVPNARVVNYHLTNSQNYVDLRPLDPKNLLSLNNIFGKLSKYQLDNFKNNYASFLDCDFVNESISATANVADFQSVVVGAGSSNTFTTLNNFDSVIASATGTTATGTAYYRSNGLIQITTSKAYELWIEFDLQWSAVSSGTQRYTTRGGIASNTLVADPLNGIFVRYSDNLNGGLFQCVSRSAGVESILNSGTAGGTGKVKVKIQIINGTDIFFYLNDIKTTDSITTNIPLNTNLFFGVGNAKSIGTTSAIVYTDYYNAFAHIYSGR